MATERQIKKFLEKTELTEEQVDKLYVEASLLDPSFNRLYYRKTTNWRELDIHVLETLPDLKRRHKAVARCSGSKCGGKKLTKNQWIELFLAENGKTDKDMEALYEDALLFSVALHKLARAGVNTWTKLNTGLIEGLLTMRKEYELLQTQIRASEELAEQAEVEAAAIAEQERQRKLNDKRTPEQKAIDYLLSGDLHERDLAELCYSCVLTEKDGTEHRYERVDLVCGKRDRWTQAYTTCYKVGDHYFALDWHEGLTENQDDEFYDQPYEVTRTEMTETRTVYRYAKKE